MGVEAFSQNGALASFHVGASLSSMGDYALGGDDALAEALAALEGVWLPAGLWESVVLPARVADYRPAMLDELIASGEVVWQARPGDESASGQRESGRRGPGERGLSLLHISDPTHPA